MASLRWVNGSGTCWHLNQLRPCLVDHNAPGKLPVTVAGCPVTEPPLLASPQLLPPPPAAPAVSPPPSRDIHEHLDVDQDAPTPMDTPWGCPRKAAAGQAAQPPLGKAARLRGRRPSAPKAVATEEGPQAPERPPGALPDEAAREASTGRAVGVVAATAAAAALGAAAKSEGAAGTRRGPNLWTKNERQNPGGQRGATGSDASCAPQ
ncbi:uncharacterized protein LOC126470970 [Schistocerca serialis cubense]|uniref:uncharacterized protein LOC126470970 n=1 Tax=Schistocerca serialis cubense TaxID=2023355 RepID=UPI00214F55BA|nr:uncharacterized protein LOC126470970 [Schistocerca serialis cubense]